MTTQLSDEQRCALEQAHGKPVYVVDAARQSRFVLVPADVFQRLVALLGVDDFDIAETYAAQDQAAAQAWSLPEDAAYDEYDAHRQQS
jgi:hypothetical protein